MANFSLEVCVDSLHGALEAQRGGAARLELCTDLSVGGLTPSYGLMKLVKERICIPVHVLIRPRPGNFVYSETEIDVMMADIEAVGQLGLQGVAIGALTKTRAIDMKAMRILLDECRRFNLNVTFHRAFDVILHPVHALQDIRRLGDITRILTSGQHATAMEGIEFLRELTRKSNGRLGIMPGGGITDENAAFIVQQLGASELHGSVRQELDVCHPHHLLPKDLNAVVWTVDSEKVHRIVHFCKDALAENPCLCQLDSS